MKNFFKQGITFVEIIIVIAILLIIIAIAVPNFNGLKKNQLLNNFNEEILLALNKAKSLSLSSLNSSEYGVHFSTNEVVFFKGKVFSSGNPNNEVISLMSPVFLSNISLSGGASDVYFNRLSALPSAFGQITISNSVNSKIILISSLGVISDQ